MIEERVQQAYAERRVLRIRYQTANESQRTTVRDIDVYAFDEVYVDAYCRLRKERRTFRLDRIKDALVLDDRFDLDPEIEHQIKIAGLSKQAHECQRPCCRLAASSTSPSQTTPLRAKSESRGWYLSLLRLLGIVE